MAEKGGGGDGVTAVTRRPSFRRALRDNQFILPDQYLEALEQKRRQLDESIHKYVAAKEREYKVYEKDVRQQAKSADASPSISAQQEGGQGSSVFAGMSQRRLSSESASEGVAGSPQLHGQEAPAADDIASSAQAAKHDGEEQSMASVDPAASKHEKEFLGVFTPQYLPALDNGEAPKLQRADSAPETRTRDDTEIDNDTIHKADSDSGLQAKAKRPAHLQAVRRTSSSGSSADGKLASAMKSPAHYANPSKKRVSLAVGDSIVAPSDNVPLALDHHTTPSHSRTRVPVVDSELSPEGEKATAIMDFAAPPALTSMQRVERIMSGAPASSSSPEKESQALGRVSSLPGKAVATNPTPAPRSNIDPDGDLFDLEDESGFPHTQAENDDFDRAMEADEDAAPGILGRVDPDVNSTAPTGLPMSSISEAEAQQHADDSEADSMPEATTLPSPDTPKDDEHAIHLEYSPGFAGSSQQPTQPGFRRPSVNADPVFRGANYEAVEAQAVDDEIYGSSYTRPTSSFTGGSLGGSYMAKHAEGMMKMRMAQKQTG